MRLLGFFTASIFLCVVGYFVFPLVQKPAYAVTHAYTDAGANNRLFRWRLLFSGLILYQSILAVCWAGACFRLFDADSQWNLIRAIGVAAAISPRNWANDFRMTVLARACALIFYLAIWFGRPSIASEVVLGFILSAGAVLIFLCLHLKEKPLVLGQDGVLR